MVDGSVDVGPNAVLSFKREGYKKTDFAWKDFLETMTYPGFWKLAGRYTKEGLQEMIRSYRKKLFVQNVQRFMPEIQENDLIPGPAGVRAQALRHDGTLVDDFYLLSTSRMTHVLNAPSPAATASIEIGKEIVGQIKKRHVS
jgi:L-2-hydroxyglutarate oxidase